MGAIFLLSFAIYNGFPFIYPDTGTYIESGFKIYVPSDRPIYYGLFIAASGIFQTLWATVFIQSFFLSLVLWWTTKYVLKQNVLSFLLIVSFTSLFSGVGLAAGHLIPDIFTPIFIISCGLILTMDLPKMNRYVLYILVVLCILVHTSILLLSWIITTAVIISSIVQKSQGPRQKIWVIIALSASLILPTGHWLIDGDFSITKRGYLFHLNRLAEDGVLKNYLEDQCPTRDLILCPYKNQINNNFLWDTKNSPLYKLGGWQANEKEYRNIVSEIHTSPEYWASIAWNILKKGTYQLYSFSLFDVQPVQGDRVNKIIDQWFPNDGSRARNGYQENDVQYVYQVADIKDSIFLVLLVISVLWLIITPKHLTKQQKKFVALVFALILINAYVTGGLSTVVPRYQARVIWLILFFATSGWLRYLKTSSKS